MNPDLSVLHFVNGLCGSRALDLIAVPIVSLTILKGGITVAAYWWFWHAGRQRQWQMRRILVAALLGAFLAIVVSRALTVALPFRVRPMYTAGIGYRPPAIPFNDHAENWSSFPSDHAAMWFALTYGLWLVSRRAGIIAALYSTVWICLPRLYLGIHYPSDLVAGGIIGLACGWISVRLPIGGAIDQLLLYERRAPSAFYATAFLLTYETATTFNDVRKLLHGLRILHIADAAAIVVGSGATVIALALLWLATRRRHHDAPGSRPQPDIAPAAGGYLADDAAGIATDAAAGRHQQTAMLAGVVAQEDR